jgi:hypothetical protein
VGSRIAATEERQVCARETRQGTPGCHDSVCRRVPHAAAQLALAALAPPPLSFRPPPSPVPRVRGFRPLGAAALAIALARVSTRACTHYTPRTSQSIPHYTHHRRPTLARALSLTKRPRARSLARVLLLASVASG